jgi:monofunctional biosynthetic peptidoglycan transglycosylase
MVKKTLKYFGIALLSLLFLLIFTILLLRWVNPPFTSFTLQADWDQLERESYNLRTEWVHRKEIPEHMIWAVVAAEDQLFFEHFGFDIESIQEAWEERREGERTRGASTISQQVAKNLFLSPAQSFFRKGVEAGITVLIELLWPKERIVEVYLNIAEFGPGVFGIGKASEVYFNRPASQLTPEMAARFAAVLPSPKRMRVNPPSPYTQERSRWILRQMNQLTGKTFYTFEANNQPSDDEPEMPPDSSLQTLQPDTSSFDIQPDTLFRSIPDTNASVTDSADTTAVE